MSSTEEAGEEDRGWIYVSAVALAVILLCVGLAVVWPSVSVRSVQGLAVANERDVAAAAADRKAADEAAAARKAADDAAAFLASLQDQIKVDMQQYVDDPANGLSDYGVHVYEVNLVKVGDNKYEGMADMQAGSGPRKQVDVHVTADDNNILWETDKGGLLPLFQ